jgi:hypothetical protein
LLSSEHFSVDGTSIEVWASQRRFQRQGGPGRDSDDDPGNPTVDFRGERRSNVTPHVAQNTTKRSSRIDARTVRQKGYEVSQRKRKRIEECFSWMKTVGLMRKTRHRGRDRVGWMFIFTTAIYVK